MRARDALTPAQGRILEALDGSDAVLVWAAPRAGATTLALSAAAEAMARDEDPARVVLLAPTRTRAAQLRDALTAEALALVAAGQAPHRVPTVATPTALAFAYVRAREAKAGRPTPSLVTGADQDALIATILQGREESFDPYLRREALTLPGFRTEVRDVLSRCTERGLDPAALRAAAVNRENPVWAPLADLYAEYLQVLTLSSATALEAGSRLDGGQLIDAAVAEAALGDPLALLIIDDAQDLTAAGVRLASALAARATRTLVLSSPDEAVEGFRGGLADAASRIARHLEQPGGATRAAHGAARRLTHVTLATPLGTTDDIARVTEELRTLVPLAGAPARSRAPQGAPDGERPSEPVVAVATLVAASEDDEARSIATAVRALMSEQRVFADDLAIVCRSTGAAHDLADRLSRQDIAVDTTAIARALRDEPVIHDLFLLLDWALGYQSMHEDAVVRLLRGPFGDADDMAVRTIRRLLIEADPSARSGTLLVEAVTSDQPLDLSADLPVSRVEFARGALAPLERLRRMRAAIHEARGSGLQAILWAAWEASGRAPSWQAAALADRHVSERARARVMNRRIDALTTLMDAADRYEERAGGQDIAVFMANVRAGAIPEDSLSPRARVSGTIRVMTPAAIAGQSVDTVILAGLQEGAWPNARIRSSLLGAADLALFHDHPETATDPQLVRAIQREAVIADEVRLAVAALSRARSRVLVTAVASGESRPSALFSRIQDAARRAAGDRDAWSDAPLSAAAPGPYPDARQLVGSLRRALESEAPSPGGSDVHALLAQLVDEGIEVADPATWYHQEVSTRAPLVDEDAVLGLSPSALELAEQCPRAFLLERAGGQGAPGAAQSLGTLIHRLAEQHPSAGATALIAALIAEEGEPGEAATWRERAEWERKLSILEKLGAYQEAHPDVVAVERPFALDLGSVRLRGTIDRVEEDGAGVRVVDYKTAKTAVSADAAQSNLQLGAYQRALSEDPESPPVTGASLVYVGTSTKNASVRHQSPPEDTADPAWFENAVQQIDSSLRAASITLTPNPHCGVCAVKTSCPLYAEGAQL